jgi:hypothetical protein
MFGRHGSRPEVIPTGALACSEDGIVRSAGDVIGDNQFDVETEVCPSLFLA